MSVDQDMHILVHPKRCGICLGYAKHLADMMNSGSADILYDKQVDHWDAILCDKAYNRGYEVARHAGEREIEKLRDLQRCDSEYISELKDTVADRDDEIEALKAKLAVLPVPAGVTDGSTDEPQVAKLLALRIDAGAPPAVRADKGKGKALASRMTEPSADVIDVDMADIDAPISEETIASIGNVLYAPASYSQAVTAPRQPVTGPSTSAQVDAPAKAPYVAKALVGPPAKPRIYKNGVPVPLGAGGHPAIHDDSPWKAIGAKVRVGRDHPEFTRLATEAYEIPFDQRSWTQRFVVNQALHFKVLPPPGVQKQTPVDTLVRHGNEIPAAVRKDKNGHYDATDLAVWQFIRDGSPEGGRRKAFEAKALELLALNTFRTHVRANTESQFWNATHYAGPDTWDDFDVATHYHSCGLTEAAETTMFRRYACNHAKWKAQAERGEEGAGTVPPAVPTATKRRATAHPKAPAAKRAHATTKWRAPEELSSVYDSEDDDIVGMPPAAYKGPFRSPIARIDTADESAGLMYGSPIAPVIE
jgi:hypothetical protein